MFLWLPASFADFTVGHCRLHVFFGCYHNLFRLMAKCGVLENLLLKEHTHTFVNTGVHMLCTSKASLLAVHVFTALWLLQMHCVIVLFAV